MIWARFSGHKKAARLLTHISGTRIHVAFLPAYAPELNVVAHSLVAKHRRQDLLQAFFQHARLDL